MSFQFDANNQQTDDEVCQKFKISDEELKKLSKYKLKGASYWEKVVHLNLFAVLILTFMYQH